MRLKTTAFNRKRHHGSMSLFLEHSPLSNLIFQKLGRSCIWHEFSPDPLLLSVFAQLDRVDMGEAIPYHPICLWTGCRCHGAAKPTSSETLNTSSIIRHLLLHTTSHQLRHRIYLWPPLSAYISCSLSSPMDVRAAKLSVERFRFCWRMRGRFSLHA